jgi:hypothetical protein
MLTTSQMTCLFWYESVEGLKAAEMIRSLSPGAQVARLPTLARPHEQFRKWVLMVLSTTQVTQNVILLALLFIYRLKMSTRQIKGRAGSEYRLLIVALMLGNKFLDDNTYTNKTWAEVSAFAVKEIHVMEVEFLSNMRYNLLASKAEWEGWLDKLTCFREYYERALRLPASPVHGVSPTSNIAISPIPSPTGVSAPSIHDVGLVAPINISPRSMQAQTWAAVHSNAMSPLAMKPSITLPRKRSIGEDLEDHPAKRLIPSSRLAQPVHSVPAQPTVRPPPPHLTLVTNQHQSLPPPHMPSIPTQQPTTFAAPPNAYAIPPSTSHVSNHVSLPPLQHGTRAMATVYQQPQIAMPQQAAPVVPTLPLNGYPGSSLPSHTPAGYCPAGKVPSPGSLAPYSNSPMPDQFAPGGAILTPIAHTPISNSPSVYLQQRSSPYRPIRHVNTLLYPPPSASLDQYHLSVPLQPTQMHYQPLGRRNDLRTGVVPEFVMYNRNQQQHQQLPQHNGHYHG